MKPLDEDLNEALTLLSDQLIQRVTYFEIDYDEKSRPDFDRYEERIHSVDQGIDLQLQNNVIRIYWDSMGPDYALFVELDPSAPPWTASFDVDVTTLWHARQLIEVDRLSLWGLDGFESDVILPGTLELKFVSGARTWIGAAGFTSSGPAAHLADNVLVVFDTDIAHRLCLGEFDESAMLLFP